MGPSGVTSLMGGTLFSPEGKLTLHRAEIKQGIIIGKANFMMGGTLFSPGGKLVHRPEESSGLLWGRPIS